VEYYFISCFKDTEKSTNNEVFLMYFYEENENSFLGG